MANKFNIGDKVRYVGTEPQIPAGATGVVQEVDTFFPGSILAVNDADGYVLGIADDVAELVEAAPEGSSADEFFRALFGAPVEIEAPKDDAPAELAVGDRVELIDPDGEIAVVAPKGALGTVADRDGDRLLVVIDRELSLGGNYPQIMTVAQVEKVVEVASEAPVELPAVKPGDRVRLAGYTDDTDGLEGTVLSLPNEDTDYYEVDVDDLTLPFADGYLLERGEFELIEEVAKENDAKDALEADIADFDILAGRLIGGAKKATDPSLASLLEMLAVGFALDPRSGEVVRELIGKGDAA